MEISALIPLLSHTLTSPAAAIGGGVFGSLFALTATVLWVRERRRTHRRSPVLLLVSERAKLIQGSTPGLNRPMKAVFEEEGFDVAPARSITDMKRFLTKQTPSLIILDDETRRHSVAQTVEVLDTLGSRGRIIPVLVYNVPVPRAMAADTDREQFHFLGKSFSADDLLHLASRLVSSDPKHPSKTTVSMPVVHALEGRIIDDSLQEALQFIEVAHKSGCLMVDGVRHHGMIYVSGGLIVHAAASDLTDQNAVIDMLRLRRGSFRFLDAKKPGVETCSLAITATLMEFARRLDESRQNAGCKEDSSFYIPAEHIGDSCS